MPSSKTEVVLTGIDNWDDWQKFVASLIDIDIWEAIKPINRTQVLLRKPRRPQASDFNPNAESEANLTASQVNAFKLARDNWKDSSKEYELQKTNLVKAKSVIISYVDERLGRYLDQDDDLPRWVDCLAVAVNAEQTKAADALALEYQQLIQSFSCTDAATFTDWIWKWENFLLKAARHRMLEVKDTTQVVAVTMPHLPVQTIDFTISIRPGFRLQSMEHLMLGSSFNLARVTYQKFQRL